MRQFDRLLIVANPTSGRGLAGRRAERVAETLRHVAREMKVVVTRGAGHARESVASLDAGRNLAVAFGGDGTFNELLNGAELDHCTLAVIPAGTGNVLAKELGMSRRPAVAARQLLRARPLTLDMGLCNGRRFICMFGAGLDAQIVRLIHEARGNTLTQLNYVPYVIRSVLDMPEFRIATDLDGRPFASGAVQVSVGNTHSYGGPMEMTPAASPHDGLLDAMSLRLRSLLDVPRLTACGLLRALHLCRHARYGRGRELVVRSEAGEVPYELDGEAAGMLPARISMRPAAVRVLAAPGYGHLQRHPPEP
ncbi:MAG: diacylglycerol kinase family lipid kinase [Candidatus Brocadiia bacterium]